MANLINTSHDLWFVVYCSQSCIGLDHDFMLLTINTETSSIIINVATPMWSIMVTSFKYLQANLDDRLQINKGGDIDCF